MSRLMPVTPELMAYIAKVGVREHPALAHCRSETAKLPNAMMQIGSDQGGFMALVAKLVGARRYLEIGTFTGYSALAVALALPADGKVVACDVSKEFTDKARGFWREAGVENKIDLRLGPALETLDSMVAANEPPFDFAFIDADKTSYAIYYEEILKRLRKSGLMIIDNVLWSGAVDDEAKQDADTQALRKLNDFIAKDTRVEAVMLGIADGLTIVRKK